MEEQSDESLKDAENLWAYMTAECLSHCPTKLPSCKRLLVLGDDEANKNILVARLHGSNVHCYKTGNGLEYCFLNVRDEYCENQTKLEVWLLEDCPQFRELLKYVLNENHFQNTTVIIVGSMTAPWNIYGKIITWTKILQEHIEGLGLPECIYTEQKLKILERYRDYIEPGLSAYGTLPGADNEIKKEIKVNLGVDIIIVVTHTEHIKFLESDCGYESEHFDFMQLVLRELSLSYGASLFYVSVKEDKNCDLLLKYILHRIYSFPFRIPAILLEKDSIFVPSGWDSENKIRILAETLNSIPLSTPFEDVIYKPRRILDRQYTAEITALPDQEFLLSLQNNLFRVESEATPSEPRTETLSNSNAVQRVVPNRRPRPSPIQKKQATNLAPRESDTILHTFFKNLLDKRKSLPADRPIGLSGQRTFLAKQNEEQAENNCEESSENVQCSVKMNGNKDSRDLSYSQKGRNEFQRSISHTQSSFPDELKMASFMDEIGTYEEKLDEFQSNLQFSLEQEHEKQLPEYFLSSASAHFQEDDGQVSPLLDRVKSSFNPPLHLLLEDRKERNLEAPTGAFEKLSPSEETISNPVFKKSEDS